MANDDDKTFGFSFMVSGCEDTRRITLGSAIPAAKWNSASALVAYSARDRLAFRAVQLPRRELGAALQKCQPFAVPNGDGRRW
jgi:hypothetical protein